MKNQIKLPVVVENERGAVGYLVAWLLGVPAGLLVLVFLLTKLF